MSVDVIKSQALEAGQEHIFESWASLTKEQQQELIDDVKDFDFHYINRCFEASINAPASSSSDIEPLGDDKVLKLTDGTPEEREAWRQHGLQLIAEGKAAILLLAGGQGTRLGSALPKGCYDCGLPSHKSLFQVQAERLLRLQQLAATSSPPSSQSPPPAQPPLLHWYVMTSPFTHADTLAHFESHDFFGLQRGQVHFFQQDFLPCLTEGGKVILESPHRVAKAPNGNGGVYLALSKSGCLADMASRGVQCLDVYCVDNLLARLGDPLVLGYCHARGAECGARVVAKAHPGEKVGVFALRAGQLGVVEYSEMEPGRASAAGPDGRLLFNWSNICMHYFSVAWLQQVVGQLQSGSAYHIARKAIPSKDGPVPGVKLELFIFDTFPLARATALVEVDRADEFAAVKNAPGSASDSPDTARAALLQLHARWVQAAGGKVECGEGVEVSPLLSYAGEGLEGVCKGQTFKSAFVDGLQAKAV